MEILILIIAAFVTSSISAVLGMGGGIILLGIMAIIIPEGYKVIALHGIVQLFSNSTRTYVFRQYVKKNLIKQFSIGAIIGILLSIIIIVMLIKYFEVQSANQIKVEVLKPFIGFFIIWYLFLKGPKKEKKTTSFIPVGLIAGLSSIFIGAVGGLIVVFGTKLLFSFKLDDVVGAIPAHMFAGIWGTLAVPLTNTDATFSAQLIGVLSINIFVFAVSYIIWSIMKATFGIRLSKEAETKGTDVTETGVIAYAIRD